MRAGKMEIRTKRAKFNTAEGKPSTGFYYGYRLDDETRLVIQVPNRIPGKPYVEVRISELELQSIVEWYRKERGKSALI
jgi:hypothetical protein